MPRTLSSLAVLIALVGASSSLRAQEREGFWLAVGVAPGAAACKQLTSFGESRCSTGRTLGFSGLVEGGGTLSRKILLGVAATGWTLSASDTTRQFGAITLMVQYYPSETFPGWAKAGFGYARFAESRTTAQALTANGFVFQLAVGYDVGVGSSIAVAPFAQGVLAHGLSATLGRVDFLENGLDFNMVQVGLRVHWQRRR